MKNNLISDIGVILEKIPKNADNCVITDCWVDCYDTIYTTKSGEICVFSQKTKEKISLDKLNENTLYEIFIYLDANKQILASRNTIVELSATENTWEIEPIEVKNGDEVIGMIGVAVMEEVEDKKLLSVVFISPDGTFSNLTMFGNDNAEEVELARNDLLIIGKFLVSELHNLIKIK